MGAFDDLIPAGPSPREGRYVPGQPLEVTIGRQPPAGAGAGSFDDLIPVQQPAPGAPTLSPEDIGRMKAIEELTTLPAPVVEGMITGRQRAQGLPILGGLVDEGLAAGSAAGHAISGGRIGQPYDQGLAYQRELNRVAQESPGATRQQLGTLAATAPFAPVAKVIQGAGTGATAINMGLTGLGYGAGEAFTRSQGGLQKRAEDALLPGAGSGGVNALLGALLGRYAGRGSPQTLANIAGGNQAARDAQALGVQIPRFAATTPDSAAMGTAMALEGVPVIGTPIRRSVAAAVGGMNDVSEQIMRGYSPRVLPRETTQAGARLHGAFHEFLKGEGPGSAAKTLSDAYDKVDALVPPTAFSGPLQNTVQKLIALTLRDRAKGVETHGPVVKMLSDAVSRPQGLTYQGLKDLRTTVGQMMDDRLLPSAGTVQPGLKQIYGALTQDLKAMLRNVSPQAFKAWRDADTLAKLISGYRKQVAKVIGLKGEATEGQIVERILSMASSKSRGDTKTLARLQRVLRGTLGPKAGKEAWDDLAATAIHQLGKNQSNEFSLAIFSKNYNALTNEGKRLLFDATGKTALREQLDALHRSIGLYKNLEKLQNRSNSGAVMAAVQMIVGGGIALANVPSALALGITERVIAQSLAKPVTVKAVNQFYVKLYEFMTGRGGRTAVGAAINGMAQHVARDAGTQPEIVAQEVRENARKMGLDL